MADPSVEALLLDMFDTTGGTTAGLRKRIVDESLRQGVDPALMLALAQHESGFNPNAVSPTNVTGLFQVTNDTGKDYGQTPQARRNPDTSMQAGIAYFKQLLRDTGGDTREALRRYGDPNVANYPDLVYAQYANHIADVPQNAQTQRLMAQTQRRMQPRAGSRGQSGATRDPSVDELLQSMGFGAVGKPPASPTSPPPAPSAQPKESVQTAIQAIQPLQPANVGQHTEMTWQGPALREGEAPRQVDPRTMDDDALLKQIGINPTLVKQSRFYKPGIFQNMLVTPGSWGERLMQSPLGGVLEGVKMPLAGAEQLAAHGLEAAGITSPADTAFTDAMIKLKRTEYAQTSRPTVNVPVLGPVSPPELAGQMLLPIPGAGGALAMNPAGSFLANTGRGLVNAAVGGAIGGATQPVYDPGTTYAQQKAGQVGTGAVAGTAIGAVPAVIGAAAGVNRAARAVEQAQAGTAEDVTTAAAKTAEQQAAFLQKRGEDALKSQAAAVKAETQAAQQTEAGHAKWLQQMEAQRQDLQGQLLQRKASMDTAQRLQDEAYAEAQAAYTTGSREAYQAAVEKLRTLGRDYDTAVAAHQSLAAQLQALPEKYAPQMPQRTMQDVMRDMRFLDQEGAPREAVIQRLGAQDAADASRMLRDEGAAYMQAGQQMPGRPGEAVAPSFRQPALPGMADEAMPSVLRFIKNNGDMRLTGEELASDFTPLMGGYVNNKTGTTADRLAQMAHEAGLISSPDKQALLRAVDQERLRQQQPAMPSSAPAVAPEVPDLGGGKVSSRLYARFDEAGARTPVDFTPAKNAVAEVRDQLGIVPPSGQPTIIQKIAKDIDDMGTQGNASQGYEIMKSLGKAMRSGDGKTRYLAQQIFEGVTNAMEQSAPPELLTMLQQAKTAWKTEQGVNVLHELFGKRPGILKENEAGQMVVNVATLRNSLKNKRRADELTKWLGPEAYARLVEDVNAVQAPPAIPKQAPPRTPLELVDASQIPARPVPQTIWDVPGATGTRTQRGRLSPVTLEDLPQMPPPVEPDWLAPTPWSAPPGPVQPPAPREPVLKTPWSFRELTQPSFAIPAALTFAKSGGYLPAAAVGVAADLTSYGLAHVLLSEAGRPFLQYLMHNGGVIPPEIAARLGYIGGAASSRPERAGERRKQVEEFQRRALEQLQGGKR